MQRGDDPPLHVKAEHIHSQLNLHSRTAQKGCYTAISQFLGRIPDHLISRKAILFLGQLGGRNFDFLQADHIRLLLPYPVNCPFCQGGAQAIDVP